MPSCPEPVVFAVTGGDGVASTPALSRRQLLERLGRLGLSASLGAVVPMAGCHGPEPLLRVATNAWPGYAMLHAAQSLGRLDGQRIRMIEMPSSTDVIQALSAGSIEAGALTLDELLSARADGIDLCAVLVFDESTGGDALVARPELHRIQDLRGKRIGVEQTGGGALVLDAALRAGGLGMSEVTPVYVTASRHLAAWNANEIDALVCFEPVLGHLRRLGAISLFDSSTMAGCVIDVLAVRTEALTRSPQALHALLQVQFELLAQWRSDPQSLAPTLAAGLGLRPEQVPGLFGVIALQDLDDNHRWLGGSADRLTRAADAVQQQMQRARLLLTTPPLDRLGSAAFLPPAVTKGRT